MSALNYHIDENKERILLSVSTPAYSESIRISNLAFNLGEELNHHATVTTHYSKVEISINTHDSGYLVTEKDREFIAKLVSKL